MYNLFNFDYKKIHAYAHSKSDGSKESFVDHCDLTIKYYDDLIVKYNLIIKIKKLLIDILGENYSSKIENIVNIIRKIVLLHDIGKLTDDFQRRLGGESNRVTHSDLSYFFIAYCIIELSDNKKLNFVLTNILLILSYSVLKHHGRLDDIKNDLGNLNFKNKKIEIENIFKKTGLEINEKFWNDYFSDNKWKKRWNSPLYTKFFEKYVSKNYSFFILSKLIFSLLITSDYWATMEFVKGSEYEINLLSKSQYKKIFHKFHFDFSGNNFNPKINEKREEFLTFDLNKIQETNSNKENLLNTVRSFLNIKAERELEEIISKNSEQNIFMLNVPTGGGKTNLSLRLALKIAELKEIKKMFFVFPFINIIDQNFDVISKFLGKENVERLDSRFVSINDEDELASKDIYARFIDNQFMNKPFLFLSHVKFFDMFFRNDKNSNYNFHQLSDSIVVIDEIQSYDDKIWTEVSNIISFASKFLNTYFIIMSATLPDINLLKEEKTESFIPVFNKEFTKDLFSIDAFNRVKIKPDNDLKLLGDKDINSKKIIELIKKHKKNNKILFVLNTIKDSFLLFKYLMENKEKLDLEHELLLLNSTIVQERREEILRKCRDENSSILLISTQSIEAGVDIDFDIGFRAYAPLDNIIQVAGRINRNNKKAISELIVFPDKNANRIYRNSFKSDFSLNADFINTFFSKHEINEFDENRIFYDSVIESIRERNWNIFIKNSTTNLFNIKNLKFKEIDEELFLIKGNTISLYLPINEDAINLWNKYLSFFDEDFCYEKILEIKEYRKKLTKYSINIFNYSHNNSRIKNILNEEIKYGYYYCKNFEKYYDKEKGLNVDKFKEIINGHEFEIF